MALPRKPQRRPRAKADLEHHAFQIADENIEAAIRFVDAVESTIGLLCEHPELGGRFVTSDHELLDIRAKPVNGFGRFVIFYRDHGDTIEVVRLLAGGDNMDVLIQRED